MYLVADRETAKRLLYILRSSSQQGVPGRSPTNEQRSRSTADVFHTVTKPTGGIYGISKRAGRGIFPHNGRPSFPPELPSVSPPNRRHSPSLFRRCCAEMLGRDNVLKLLNKPARFYPRVSKRVPVCQVPACMKIPADIGRYPTRPTGMPGGYTRSPPGTRVFS